MSATQEILVAEVVAYDLTAPVGERLDAALKALEFWQDVCPFDCDECHDEDQCPCMRGTCKGWTEKYS